jgi:hypothetical protein
VSRAIFIDLFKKYTHAPTDDEKYLLPGEEEVEISEKDV